MAGVWNLDNSLGYVILLGNPIGKMLNAKEARWIMIGIWGLKFGSLNNLINHKFTNFHNCTEVM